jgi:two-component system, NarL family, invasion response regulator UvrY
MPKILVVDDHAMVRKGVIRTLEESPSVETACDEASTAKEAEQKVATGMYDLVLLDISIPGSNGLELLKKLHKTQPDLPIMIFSMLPEDQYAVRALTLGAVGYLTKESAPEELIIAVRKVLSGGRYVSSNLADRLAAHLGPDLKAEGLPHERLSDREFQILCMIGEGKTPTQIGHDLFISIKTVSTYRSRLLQKMELKNNAELMSYVIKNNLIA